MRLSRSPSTSSRERRFPVVPALLAVLAVAAALAIGFVTTTSKEQPTGEGRPGPQGILPWDDGVARATVSGSGRVVLLARADLCGDSSPQLEVLANGRAIGRNTIVNGADEGFWDYPTGPDLEHGTHHIEVRYLNDWSGEGCDRDVELKEVIMSTPSEAVAADEPSSPGALAGNPFAEQGPYANPGYASAAAADERRRRDPEAAAALDRITQAGVAEWVGDWVTSPRQHVQEYVARAHTAGKVPYLVTYAIPQRDCGNHSAGGLTEQTYNAWTQGVADGIEAAGGRTVVIVEPDAVAQIGACEGQGDRAGMIRESVRQLDAAGATVYIDAGNSSWKGDVVNDMASRLRNAGVDQARGFATNVSNFIDTPTERAYAERLRTALGGQARYVIDTSRNGAGSNGEWCNPPGRKIGTTPRAVDDGSGLDAYLWIKRAGQSDGTCNGGPPAGQFWPEYAIALAS